MVHVVVTDEGCTEACGPDRDAIMRLFTLINRWAAEQLALGPDPTDVHVYDPI